MHMTTLQTHKRMEQGTAQYRQLQRRTAYRFGNASTKVLVLTRILIREPDLCL